MNAFYEKLERQWRKDKVYRMVDDAFRWARKSKARRYNKAIPYLSDVLLTIRLGMLDEEGNVYQIRQRRKSHGNRRNY
jgi:hypothetical protein